MFQFQFQSKKEHEADRPTNPEDSEGLEIEIAAADAAVISDDAADGVNEVPSMSPSSKKNKKKKYGGLTKIIIGTTFAVAAIVIGVAASKAANRASTDLQLAKNEAQADYSMTSHSKSGKGCKDEVQVCVFDPIGDIFSYILYVIFGGPFTVPDDTLPDVENFSKYLKKYNRNCTDFWANVFYVIQYVIVSILNSLCPLRRVLTASAAVIAPATRALNDLSALVTGLIPTECDGLLYELIGLGVGEVCIEEIADDIAPLESLIGTCLAGDWSGMDITVMQDTATVWMNEMMATVNPTTICAA